MEDTTLVNLFTYHPPTPDQLTSYAKLRSDALSFARAINDLVPESADKTAAIRKLRECVMTANAAIACHVPNPPRPTIAELEKILNSEDDIPITINPDGSLTTDPQ